MGRSRRFAPVRVPVRRRVSAGPPRTLPRPAHLGLEDPSRLPDRTSILASLWALLTPFAITYADRRFLRRREVAAEKEEERERRRPSAGGRTSPRRY